LTETADRTEKARRPILSGLRFRMAAFLVLALLPIGLLGILQTVELSREVRSRSELTLLALTNNAAFGERQIYERAFGAAEALSSVLRLMRNNPASCSRYLREYLDSTNRYSFIGFLPRDGVLTCSSAPGPVDFGSSAVLAPRLANPEPWIARRENPAVSGEPVINVLHPVSEDGAFIGYVSISIPLARMDMQSDVERERVPLSLITYGPDGNLLSEESNQPSGEIILPRDRATEALTLETGHTFVGLDRDGTETVFAVVPIIPGLAYALGAWPLNESIAPRGALPGLFPALMLATSLAVAFLALDRLVVRHINRLRHKMRAFGLNRQLPPAANARSMPQELRDLDSSFREMAFTLMDDEARMEDALREKNVLLKEVHHRVKNNLQLISSIMNMQVRKSPEPAIRRVLQRLQERILSLSTVHRNLYQADSLDRIDAGRLLSELVDQLVRGTDPDKLDCEMDFDPVILFPDQAVPLSLLASELVTNALKYLGAPEGSKSRLRVSLKEETPGQVRLTCGNSLSDDPTEPDADGGLGMQLVHAFAGQLGGRIEIEETPDFYRATVLFAIEDFTGGMQDH
jgi:two-component sensor histidine kinase